MTVEWTHLAPTTAVLALVAYCAWSLDEPFPPKKAKERPALTAKMLTFQPGEPPRSDPFRCKPLPVKQKTALAAKPSPTKDAVVEKALKAIGSSPKPTPPGPKRIEAVGLRLTGTLIGNSRLAVINGKVYGEGELVQQAGRPVAAKTPPATSDSTNQWTVVRVWEGKALLRRGDEEAELLFDANRPAKAALNKGSTR